MSDKNLIAGAGAVAASEGFVDYGKAFSAGYAKSLENKKERENKNKEIQTRVNNLMSGFKNDIDVLKFKPEDQTLVKNTIVGWRNEYAEAANAAAKIKDKSSPEYQGYVDTMSNIQNRMVNLKGNLDNLAAFKGEFKTGIDKKIYSNAGANDMSLAKGEVMLAYPIGGITENGDLKWQDEGAGEFSFSDYQLPFGKAKGTATYLGQIAERVKNKKNKLDDFDKSRIKEEVEALIDDPKVFASLISDGDMPAFDFSNIDPEDPNAREQTIDLLTRSIYNLQGANVSGTSATGDTSTPMQIAREEERKKVFSQIESGYEKPIPTGRKNSKKNDLYLTIDKELGVWILTDAAGQAVKGAGGNMVTFQTEEQAKKYIK